MSKETKFKEDSSIYSDYANWLSGNDISIGSSNSTISFFVGEPITKSYRQGRIGSKYEVAPLRKALRGFATPMGNIQGISTRLRQNEEVVSMAEISEDYVSLKENLVKELNEKLISQKKQHEEELESEIVIALKNINKEIADLNKALKSSLDAIEKM